MPAPGKGPGSASGTGGPGSMGGSGQGHGGGASGGPKGGMGSFGGLPGQPTRDRMRKQDLIGAKVGQALNDYRGVDDSWLDKAGNFLAGLGGFHEMNPAAPGFSKGPGVTGKADWGWDPVSGIGGAVGLGMGFPGLGLAADQISAALGRPFEINMGPSVFGGIGGGGPGAALQGGGTGNGGRGGAPRHSTGMPTLPIPKPGTTPSTPTIPPPAKPAPMPMQATPYAGAIPMPGQVKLPQNYFMSQMT